MELARFELDNGGTVTVDIDEEAGMARATPQRRVLQEARVSFEKALAEMQGAASAALSQFQAMTRQPDEVEIRFGVRLDAEAGAVIAKTGVQGHLEVCVKWRRERDGSVSPT